MLSKQVIIYGIELAIAALLLWHDQRLFFLYFFFCFLIGLEIKYLDLRKLIYGCEMLDRLRIRVIFKKLNFSEEEITHAREEAMKELGREGEERLVQLLRDVGLKE